MSWAMIPLAVAVSILIWSFRRADFIFSYPTMMVGATAYFVIPGLIHMDQHELFEDSTRMAAAIYVSACMIAAARGWLNPMDGLMRALPIHTTFPAVKPLAIYCGGAILFSSYFAWKLRGVDIELLQQTQWSGPHVIYLFLTKPGYFITSVAAVAFAVTRKKIFAVLAVVAGMMYLLPPVLGGKRDEVVEAGMIFAVCWEMVWRRRIPKVAVVAVGVFLALVFSAIGDYRRAYRSEGVTQGIVSAFESVADPQLAPSDRYKEVGNFLGVMELTLAGNKQPNFGLAYWNQLVFSYVPGQIIGHDIKQAMQFEGLEASREDVIEVGAQASTGTTFTGFSDTLQAFWFAGLFVFYLIGRFLRTMYLLANKGQAIYLFAYAHLLVMSGVGVTHSTFFFVTAIINLTIFVGIWIHYIQRNSPKGTFSMTQFYESN